MMMTNAKSQAQFASRFLEEWIEAWNSHDLGRILSHYATDIELTSTFVPRVLGIASSTVRGIGMLRLYFGEALALYPDLKFVNGLVYNGASSLVVQYQGIAGHLAAEMMSLNQEGRITRVYAHYREIPKNTFQIPKNSRPEEGSSTFALTSP